MKLDSLLQAFECNFWGQECSSNTNQHSCIEDLYPLFTAARGQTFSYFYFQCKFFLLLSFCLLGLDYFSFLLLLYFQFVHPLMPYSQSKDAQILRLFLCHFWCAIISFLENIFTENQCNKVILKSSEIISKAIGKGM